MKWSCVFCTFDNERNSEICAACSTRKGASKANKFSPVPGRFSLRTPSKKIYDGIDYTYAPETTPKRKRTRLQPKTLVVRKKKKKEPAKQKRRKEETKEERPARTKKKGKKRKRKEIESQYVGMRWVKANKIWKAQAFVDHQSVFFGSGKDEHELAKSFRDQVKDLEEEGHALGNPNYGQLRSKKRKRRKLQKPTKESKFIGLSWDVENKKWQARGKVDGSWVLFGKDSNDSRLAGKVREKCADLSKQGKVPEAKYGFHIGNRSHYEGRSKYFGILYQSKPKSRFVSNVRVDGMSRWVGQHYDQEVLARLVRKRCVEIVEEGGVLSNPLYGYRRDGEPIEHSDEVLIPKNSSDLNTENSNVLNADNSSDEEDIIYEEHGSLRKFNLLTKPLKRIKLEYKNPLVAVIEAHELQRKEKPPPIQREEQSSLFTTEGLRKAFGLNTSPFEA